MAEARSASGALFRAFNLPGRKARGEWIAPAIEVGTRSTCALNLNDPVVAERHCSLRAVGGGFVVEDLGSATGTWHNGLAVQGPVQLSSGDQVVIGVTRLTLELKQEQDRPVCEIVVEESSFHFKRSKPGEFHSDADEWVRSEVRFGRIPAVRAGAWLAGAIGVAFLALAFATRGGEKLLQPGRLDGTHAELFTSDPEARLGSDKAGTLTFQASRDKVAHDSCRVCHSQREPGSVANCVGCHAKLATQHPFLTGAAASDARLDPTVAKPAGACRLCHDVQHSARTSAESIAEARERLKQGNPGTDVCKTCHLAELGGQAERLQRIEALATLLAGSRESSATERHEFGFDEFSHRVHCGVQSIACLVCHVPDPAPDAALRGAEFKAVTFANCAACHVKGMPVAAELAGYDAAALTKLRGQLAQRKLQVTLAWHGRGERCLQCHARSDGPEQIAPELAKVERKLEQREFAIVRVAHEPHAAAARNTKADCSGCHADARTLAGGKPSSGAFWHGSHVETLWPADAREAESLSEHTCLTCHAGQPRSKSVAGGPELQLESACKACHTDPARPEPARNVTARAVSSSTVRVSEFSHELHAAKQDGPLAGGCFACHVFEGSRPGDPFARPALAEGVESCTKCHTDHQNIEQGACTFCHPAGAAAGSGSNVLFRQKKPARLDWPAGFDFNHTSGSATEGHLSYMGISGMGAGCTTCHDAANLKQADSVVELEIPGAHGSLQLCINCHVNKRGWFHWSLPTK